MDPNNVSQSGRQRQITAKFKAYQEDRKGKCMPIQSGNIVSNPLLATGTSSSTRISAGQTPATTVAPPSSAPIAPFAAAAANVPNDGGIFKYVKRALRASIDRGTYADECTLALGFLDDLEADRTDTSLNRAKLHWIEDVILVISTRTAFRFPLQKVWVLQNETFIE